MPFVSCPDCGMEQNVPRDLIGLTVDCPKCKTEFTVEDEGRPARRGRRGSPRLPGGGPGPRQIIWGVVAGIVSLLTVAQLAVGGGGFDAILSATRLGFFLMATVALGFCADRLFSDD